MPKIQYHKKEKILSIRLSGKKSVDSDIQDNIVVDYDKDGNVVNLEVMPVSMREFSRAKQYFAEIVGDK